MSRGLGRFERVALHSISCIQCIDLNADIGVIRYFMVGDISAGNDAERPWRKNFTHSVKRALSSLETKGYIIRDDHGRRLPVSGCRYSYRLTAQGETYVLLEQEAKARQEVGANQHSSLTEKIPEGEAGKSRDKAATLKQNTDAVREKIPERDHGGDRQPANLQVETTRAQAAELLNVSMPPLRRESQQSTN